MLVGEKERVGSALVVEPLRGMVWGELMALSVMRRPAFAAPGQLGLKTTEAVQLLPESSIPVQLLLARENALALLPVNWVGAAAYDLSKHLYSTVFPAAERYLSNTASTTTEPLPTADSSAYARFGGLNPAA